MPETSRPQLAEAMRTLMRVNGNGRPLTLREVSERAGVSTSTVHKMTEGNVPHCESIIRVAKAFGEKIADWLDLCGYIDIADDYRDRGVITREVEIDVLNDMLNRVPIKHRANARQAAKRAIEHVIVPMYTEVAA